MMLLGVFLLAIWVTLAFTKLHALAFVTIVMVVGLTARQITRLVAARKARPSLIRQAIHEQLPPEALARRRVMIGTYGSEALAAAALRRARESDAALVVCFIRVRCSAAGQVAHGAETEAADCTGATLHDAAAR